MAARSAVEKMARAKPPGRAGKTGSGRAPAEAAGAIRDAATLDAALADAALADAALADDALAGDAAGAVPVPAFQGFIDGLDAQGQVVGWVRPLLGGEERVIVELAENGRVVSRETAMRFRGDLVDAGIGDGKYGFQLGIAADMFDGQRHKLAVTVLHNGVAAALGELAILLPSRLPKPGRRDDAVVARATRLVNGVLGGAAAQSVTDFEIYRQELTAALDEVARNFDVATALGLLYVHILRRHIDGGGLQTRLLRLGTRPDDFADVVREIVQSDEAQGWIKTRAGYHLPGLEAIRAWTRLRPVA